MNKGFKVICTRDGLHRELPVLTISGASGCMPCSFSDRSKACADCQTTVQQILDIAPHFKPVEAEYPGKLLQDVQSRL